MPNASSAGKHARTDRVSTNGLGKELQSECASRIPQVSNVLHAHVNREPQKNTCTTHPRNVIYSWKSLHSHLHSSTLRQEGSKICARFANCSFRQSKTLGTRNEWLSWLHGPRPRRSRTYASPGASPTRHPDSVLAQR